MSYYVDVVLTGQLKTQKDIRPGDLVRVSSSRVLLWKDQGGGAITGALHWKGVGLVIARERELDCEKSLGDQLLVLAGDQFGWNITESFEKIQEGED